jgi:hypothetical protein
MPSRFRLSPVLARFWPGAGLFRARGRRRTRRGPYIGRRAGRAGIGTGPICGEHEGEVGGFTRSPGGVGEERRGLDVPGLRPEPGHLALYRGGDDPAGVVYGHRALGRDRPAGAPTPTGPGDNEARDFLVVTRAGGDPQRTRAIS